MTIEISSYMRDIQFKSFEYFWHGSNNDTCFPRDRLKSDGEPIFEIASVAGIGFALLATVVGEYRKWITHIQALERVQKIVASLQKVERFHGAFPHFVDSATCQTIPFAEKDDGGDIVETALLAQGLIATRQYFSGDHQSEQHLRSAITSILETIEWNWYTKSESGPMYWHWSPRHEWALDLPITGWNEALICYVLAAGSNSHGITRKSYVDGWTRNGQFKNGNRYLGITLPLGEPWGGPLFLSQYSFCGLRPHGLSDHFCEDYSQQPHAHAMINYRYCMEHYGANVGWGLTACDGPEGYSVNSPTSDSGVLAPTAALSSLPFLPDQANAAAKAFFEWEDGRLLGRFGLMDAFKPSTGWVSQTHLAIDQGPIVAMIENYRSGLLWDLFMQAPEVQRGLGRLGFDVAGENIRAA